MSALSEDDRQPAGNRPDPAGDERLLAGNGPDPVGEGPHLVTIGESLARLEGPAVGPLRHARTLDLGVAGAESNVAIGFRRLGGGAAWAGRVGDDEFGRLIQMTLAGQGVDVGRVIVDPVAPTALLIKERRTGRLTRVQYYRSGSAGSRLSPQDVPEDLIRRARVLHVTGITAALSDDAHAAVHAAVDTARAAGVPVSLDLNFRRALWTPAEAGARLRPLVMRSDVVFATEVEARLVTGGADASALAAGLAALGPREAIVKRGVLGAVACCDGDLYDEPAVPVETVDPVGAGDAFAAAYLAERVLGRPIPERLSAGASAGAFAVTVQGDWEGLPSREDLILMRATDDVVR
ncbi:sugar kinase [Actinoallomurus sp. NPDC052274]|uniref:sugar kinase n=1 Tax=Actinoallomurus sp. NPDC052274 TaxID=3155420 RepID=UPI003431C3B0